VRLSYWQVKFVVHAGISQLGINKEMAITCINENQTTNTNCRRKTKHFLAVFQTSPDNAQGMLSRSAQTQAAGASLSLSSSSVPNMLTYMTTQAASQT